MQLSVQMPQNYHDAHYDEITATEQVTGTLCCTTAKSKAEFHAPSVQFWNHTNTHACMQHTQQKCRCTPTAHHKPCPYSQGAANKNGSRPNHAAQQQKSCNPNLCKPLMSQDHRNQWHSTVHTGFANINGKYKTLQMHAAKSSGGELLTGRHSCIEWLRKQPSLDFHSTKRSFSDALHLHLHLSNFQLQDVSISVHGLLHCELEIFNLGNEILLLAIFLCKPD